MRRVRQQKVHLMIDRMFRAHPREVGESYGQHWRVATGFGVRMIAGGLATIVHGFVPALFTRTGSATVKALYARMRARQPAVMETPPAFARQEWQLEYEI